MEEKRFARKEYTEQFTTAECYVVRRLLETEEELGKAADTVINLSGIIKDREKTIEELKGSLKLALSLYEVKDGYISGDLVTMHEEAYEPLLALLKEYKEEKAAENE